MIMRPFAVETFVHFLLSFMLSSLFKGALDEACARPLTAFQPLRSKAQYAFQCEAECTRRTVTGFGEPVTWVFSNHSVMSSFRYGQWMVDPAADCGTIYVMPGFRDIRNMYKFDSIEQLQAGVQSEVINLPSHRADGTGAVVFNGSIYYHVANTVELARMVLSTKRVVANVMLDDATSRSRGGEYDWSGSSDIDFAVSETGLYVIHASKSRSFKMAVAKLNPETLGVERVFYLDERKSRFGNCFIVCGILYCTESYYVNATTVSFGYDLTAQVQLQTAFPFTNAYRYNSMIDYNPADRKLYSWDNKHLVTYEVLFSGGVANN